MREIQTFFLEAGGEFLVVPAEGEIVAMGGFRRTSEERAELKAMRVHPSYQRKGIGKQLLAELENRAANRGFRVIHLDIAVTQDGARTFYRKCGYIQTGRGTKEGFDVLFLEKPIHAARA